MLDVEWPACEQFVTLAVFAAMASAFGNLSPQLFGDVGHRSLLRGYNAVGKDVALFQQVESLGFTQRKHIFLFDQTHSFCRLTL